MVHAMISDIHGNLEAFEAVLKDIESQSVDRVHCLGDVIGYGCNPVECIALARKHCDTIIMGNHEYAALGLMDNDQLNSVARESTAWTTAQLTEGEIEFISDLPMQAVVDNALLVHASPLNPDQWHYLLKPAETDEAFSHFKEQICFVGHSHLPMIFTKWDDSRCSRKIGHDFDPEPDYRYVVNIGSVGQPRDDDPRAGYVIFRTEGPEIMFRRVEYDIKKTQNKMAEANIHKMLIERLEVGK